MKMRYGLPLRTTAEPFVMLQREIDRVFDSFGRGLAGASRGLMPRMDVTETDKEIEITAELPGVEEKDVEVSLADNILTLRGEKKAEHEETDDNRHLVERTYGSFSRSIELPPGVDPGAIRATMSKGVLKVTLPRPTQQDKSTKRIEVRPAV